jgi:hypothetical protein
MWAASHFADHYPASCYSEFGTALSNGPFWDALSLAPTPPTLWRPFIDPLIAGNNHVINNMRFWPVDESVTENPGFLPAFLPQTEPFLTHKASFFTNKSRSFLRCGCAKSRFLDSRACSRKNL